MDKLQLTALIDNLVAQPHESEWLEFKLNFHSEKEIGERISAIANGACIRNQPHGYLVFGIEDATHDIKGTTFSAKAHKKGNEELENWLAQRLSPRIDFIIYEFKYDDKPIVLFVIPATVNQPVAFFHQTYVRVGSLTRKLSEFPEKERKIWQNNDKLFELQPVKDDLSVSDVLNLLSAETYFSLLSLPIPSEQSAIIEKFTEESFVVYSKGVYSITNLGAILLARDLTQFSLLERKSIRVIVYKGNNKIETEREQIGQKGYAVGFEGLVNWIHGQLPANEEIGKALRKNTTMYPEIAIRELVANALVHQDFSVKGFPMIEIFSDRIEISNAGLPLVTPDRFIDSYISRNEKLANIMRRMGFCEEKGSGVDKVIFYNELYQLPAIKVITAENRTTVSMYSYKEFNHLDKNDKIRATYQHTCLKWVSNEKMTNQSLRERFSIEDKNSAIASRLIKDTLEAGMIKPEDPTNNSRKHKSYIPFWA